MASRLIQALAALSLPAAIGLGAWSLWLLARGEATPPPSLALAQVGQTRLRYDPGYAHANAGDTTLELAARFPTFAPAGADRFSKPESVVFLRIAPVDGELPPEERMSKLYVRFLEDEQWTHPGGLVMRRFEAGSPYEREELYYAPPEGRLFAARCTRPAQPPDGLPETCLSDIRVRSLEVRLRFQPDLLPEWERLSNGARALIEKIGG